VIALLIKLMNRRDFFRQGGRWVILSGIGLMTAFLAANHKIVNAEECTVSTVCKNCGKFGRCELPQAKKQLNGK
jgi:hypothetical protein